MARSGSNGNKKGGLLSKLLILAVILVIAAAGRMFGGEGESTAAQTVQSAAPALTAAAEVQTARPAAETAAAPAENAETAEAAEPAAEEPSAEVSAAADLHFRSSKLLNDHYEKHGKEMGFASAEEYERAAAAVVSNPNALHKTEAEDGDDVYYVEASNEFVIVSGDGYLRTYFLPSAGIDYYNRQ